MGDFYDGVVLISLCDFIPFIMYFSIILWIFARDSDAHKRKQIFFLEGGGVKGGVEKKWKVMEYSFSSSGTRQSPYPTLILFVISLRKVGHGKVKEK